MVHKSVWILRVVFYVNWLFPLLLVVRQHDQACCYSPRGSAPRHTHPLGKGKCYTLLKLLVQFCFYQRRCFGRTSGQTYILHLFMPMRIRFSLFRNWRLKVNCVKLNIISWKQGTGKQPWTCIGIKTCGRKRTGSVMFVHSWREGGRAVPYFGGGRVESHFVPLFCSAFRTLVRWKE